MKTPFVLKGGATTGAAWKRWTKLSEMIFRQMRGEGCTDNMIHYLTRKVAEGDDLAVAWLDMSAHFILSAAADQKCHPLRKDALTLILMALREAKQFPEDMSHEWRERFADAMLAIQALAPNELPEPEAVVCYLNMALGTEMELPDGFELPPDIVVAFNAPDQPEENRPRFKWN